MDNSTRRVLLDLVHTITLSDTLYVTTTRKFCSRAHTFVFQEPRKGRKKKEKKLKKKNKKKTKKKKRKGKKKKMNVGGDLRKRPEYNTMLMVAGLLLRAPSGAPCTQTGVATQ